MKKHVALIHDKTNLGRAMPGLVYDIRTEELSIVDGKPITTSMAVNIGETNLSSDDILDERKIAEQRKIAGLVLKPGQGAMRCFKQDVDGIHGRHSLGAL